LLNINSIRNTSFGEYLASLVNISYNEFRKEEYETEFKLENIGNSESD
jgi:hypothetical protein